MYSVFPTQSAHEQRFANVRIKPYNGNVDANSNFYQFFCTCNHFSKEKMCPKFMIILCLDLISTK